VLMSLVAFQPTVSFHPTIFNLVTIQMTVGGVNNSFVFDTGSSDLCVPNVPKNTPMSCTLCDCINCNTCTNLCSNSIAFADGTQFKLTWYNETLQISGSSNTMNNAPTGDITKIIGNRINTFGVNFKGRSSIFQDSDIFSYMRTFGLYGAWRYDITNSNSAPSIDIGKDDSNTSGFIFYPIQSNPSLDWALVSTQINFGTTVVTGNSYCLFDTGSSEIILQLPTYSSLKLAFQGTCNVTAIPAICSSVATETMWQNTNSFEVLPEDYENLPSFEIVFGSDIYVIGPDQYLYPDGSDFYQAALFSASNASENILGGAFMRGYIISFDSVQNAIGISSPNGTSPQTMNNTVAPNPVSQPERPQIEPSSSHVLVVSQFVIYIVLLAPIYWL